MLDTHGHFWIGLHDALYPCEWQLGRLEVLVNGLCDVELVLPEAVACKTKMPRQTFSQLAQA